MAKNLLIGVLTFIGCGIRNSSEGDTASYAANKANAKTIYDFKVKDIAGNDVSLADFKGKVVMIVNVASKCGLTPQYESLEAAYKKYNDKGFVILGFPANNFMGQEPGSNEEISGFCKRNYGVTFPMFSKIDVKGKDQAPLYKFLTDKKENGAVDAEVGWNFQKFLIDREGHVVTYFKPATEVTDPAVVKAIESLL